MKKMIAVLSVLTTSVVSLASSAMAETAMEEAIRRGYCVKDSIPPISAERLPDGRLKVVCPAGTIAGATPGVLGGTGLSAGAAGAMLAAGFLVLVVSGDGDGTVVTTTTTN